MAAKPKLGKVIWNTNERISLPNFFISEKYIENIIHKNVCYLTNFPWGFENIDLDLSELSAGRIGVISANGIMPDGTPFDIPNNDQTPPIVSININLFKNDDYLIIYLAYPVNQNEMSFKGYYDSKRFVAKEMELDGKNYTVAVNNFQLLIGDSDIKNHICLPIAKLIKVNSDGSIELEPLFIPPCLNIMKNKVTQKILAELHSFIQQKARLLAELFSNKNSKNNVAPQITDTLMLQLLNRYDTYCKNVFQSPSTHPHDFYNEMTLLASELATHTSDSKQPKDFLAYDHMNAENNFSELTREIKGQLNVTLERDATEVRLKRDNNGTFNSEYMPEALLTSSYYILSVSAKRKKEDIKKYIPGQCKISAKSVIDTHLRSLSTAIHVDPIATLPPSIPYRHEFVNFQLRVDEESRNAWQQIIHDKAISIHITGDYPELILNLWLVKEN